ncbi:MAG: M23 family metallopeptidase [Kineosporiaceae bacterium]
MVAAFVVFWLWHVDLSGSLRVVLAAVVIALPLALAESSGNASGDSARGRPVAVTRGSLVLALFGLVVFTDLYFAQGYSFILLSVVCLVLPLVLVASRAWGARRRRIEFGLLRHPLRRDVRPHLVQAVNVWLCCLLLGGVLAAGGVHYARIGFSLNGVQFRWAMAAYVAGVVLLAALALVPRRRVFVATNLVVALLSGFLALQLVRISVPAPEPVVLDSPLEGGWFVLNGGRSVVLNGHSPNESQALDFQLMGVNGRTHTGDAGAPLADYPGFGQPVLAPTDGRVVEVTDDQPDMPPGTNGESANTIVLDIGERYLVLGHLKQGSVIVQVGDEVRSGEPLAAVGNTGHTNEPHLHLQIQDSPTGREDAMRTYPVVFRNADVSRGGLWPFGDRGELRTGDVLGAPAR